MGRQPNLTKVRFLPTIKSNEQSEISKPSKGFSRIRFYDSLNLQIFFLIRNVRKKVKMA